MRNKDVYDALVNLFGDDSVEKEWDIAKNSSDAISRDIYCPRLDFAVFPPNTDWRIEVNNIKINDALDVYRDLISELKSADRELTGFVGNNNPRCFIAVEVENRTSRKHRLGSIINVAILGKLGVVVASKEAFESLNKIRRFLKTARDLGKINYFPQNVAIIRKEKFLSILSSANGVK